MQLNEVPESELLITSGNFAEIGNLLRSTLVDSPEPRIRDTEAIHGASRSGRVLMQDVRDGVQGIRVPLSPERAAVELMRLGREEARYLSRPTGFALKGWEIRKTTIRGKIAIIAWATWVA